MKKIIIFSFIFSLITFIVSCNNNYSTNNNDNDSINVINSINNNEYVDADSSIYEFIKMRIDNAKYSGFNEFDFNYNDIDHIEVKYTNDTLISTFNLNYAICILNIAYNGKYKKHLIPKDSIEYGIQTAYKMLNDVEKAWEGNAEVINRTNNDPDYRFSRNNVCYIRIFLKNGVTEDTRFLLHKSKKTPMISEYMMIHDIKSCKHEIQNFEDKFYNTTI